ncbi:stage VI sporulation protein F [Paenibacillus sp. TRM 82003]|nr:stage VI sporulation protein F [Paenibacillus sp. TRM 82003]
MVRRVKAKLKDPATKERLKTAVGHVTKEDLQSRATVRRLVSIGSKTLGEPVGDKQADEIVQFVLSLKIDPNNPLHLIKVWNMFR